MKISDKPCLAPTFPATLSSKALNPQPDSDLHCKATTRKPTRRKARTPRLKVTGAPAGKRSRPETPLLKWKIEEEGKRGKDDSELLEGEDKDESGRRLGRKGKGYRELAVSARKLAAGLWRLQLPEAVVARSEKNGRLGFQVS